MGRNHQLSSSFAMADPVVSPSPAGKEVWALTRRKLVIVFAVFLPWVIASSYVYFAPPGASAELFKGRPLVSFMTLRGSTNITAFGSNANQIDTELQPNFEGPENTTAIPSPLPGDESKAPEVNPNFASKEITTNSGSLDPEWNPNLASPENTTKSPSEDPEWNPNFASPENTTQSPSEDPEWNPTFASSENTTKRGSLDPEWNPNFASPENTTRNPSVDPEWTPNSASPRNTTQSPSADHEWNPTFASPENSTQSPSLDSEWNPNFASPENTTQSRSEDSEVNPTFASPENAADSFRPPPVHESLDTEVEYRFEGNGDTTDSSSPEPGEESVQPDAMAEEQDTVSETAMFANQTSPAAVGFPNQELANMIPADSRNANISTETSKREIPDETVSSREQSEQSMIAMEREGISNETSQGSCNFSKGRWVPDPRPPAYTNATCDFILEAQNCMKNGRPDTEYLYWRWQPEHCDLPQIQPRAFLTAMRNRSMAFVGDSIARNQFQSLLCLLAQIERPENTYKSPDDRENVYMFREYNFTLAVYWSPYLVHVDYRQITLPNNSTETGVDVHLDRLDDALLKRLPGIDILQISTGQWWFKFAYYMQNGQSIGCHTWPGMPACTDIGHTEPYRIAIRTILLGVLSDPGFRGSAVLRTFAPDHFEGGSWSSGGQCVRTKPGGMPISDMTNALYQVQMQVFQNVTGALSTLENQRLKMVDITNLAQERPDGHPNAYRTPNPLLDTITGQRIQKDCLHWCLPGPIDTWNELLVKTLHDLGYC